MLYYVLKALLRPALRVFYRQTDVEGRAHLLETGPLVVVANHPNTLMDPLLVGMLWQRQLRFLTSSRFFVGFGNWVLRASGAIPLYRQEDHAPPTDAAAPAHRLTGTQRAARNEDSFRASFDLLRAGGALLIFPEGSSVLTRRLRPLKSGVARIALGAEARYNWQLGVQIVPVGLNYAAADRFDSALFRRVGAPIAVATYRTQYEANPAAASRALTEAVRRALTQQLLVVRTDADAALLPALHPFVAAAEAGAGGPWASRRAFARTQTWLHALTAPDGPADEGAAARAALRQRLLAYHRLRQRLRLPAEAPLHAPSGWTWMATLLAGPVWALGVLQHYPIFGLPARLARRLAPDVEFVAPLTMVLAMVGAPLYYAAQAGLVWALTHSAALTVGYCAALPITGWFTQLADSRLAAWYGQWRLHRLARTHAPLAAHLRAEHAALAAALAKW